MLIADASVVVKWFVDEPLRPQVRHILKYQQEILSPDFVLVELVPATRILTKATELAIELNHPVYDCLYLACLSEPHDLLVTEDRRFFNKTRNTHFEDQVRYLDDPDLALPLYVSLHTASQIIALSAQMKNTHRNLVAKLTEEQSLPIYNTAELRPWLDSPAYRRLKDAIEELSETEQADILALGWLGPATKKMIGP